jgi:hypothetical protein
MSEPALSICTSIGGLEQSDRYQFLPAKLPFYMTAIQFEVVMMVCSSFVVGYSNFWKTMSWRMASSPNEPRQFSPWGRNSPRFGNGWYVWPSKW